MTERLGFSSTSTVVDSPHRPFALSRVSRELHFDTKLLLFQLSVFELDFSYCMIDHIRTASTEHQLMAIKTVRVETCHFYCVCECQMLETVIKTFSGLKKLIVAAEWIPIADGGWRQTHRKGVMYFVEEKQAQTGIRIELENVWKHIIGTTRG